MAGRARRKQSKVEALGDLLADVLRQTSKKTEALQRVQAGWERLVGPELAAHSKPVGIRRNTLYVQSEEPGTSFGLSLLKARVLQELPAVAGCEVRELVVRAGELR